jgi:cytochrome c peroxidase
LKLLFLKENDRIRADLGAALERSDKNEKAIAEAVAHFQDKITAMQTRFEALIAGETSFQIPAQLNK